MLYMNNMFHSLYFLFNNRIGLVLKERYTVLMSLTEQVS